MHPNLLRKLGKTCLICLKTANQATATACDHLFCRSCLDDVYLEQPICPECRTPFELDELIDATTGKLVIALEEEEFADKFSIPSQITSSAKVEALVADIKRLRKEDETMKCIVFSQWTTMLSLIEKRLEPEGWQSVRLDGSMSREKRSQALRRFKTDSAVFIFLASLTAGNLGINLTVANTVYILDPWWNPSTEDRNTSSRTL